MWSGFNLEGRRCDKKVALHTSCSARREMGTLLNAQELLASTGNVDS